MELTKLAFNANHKEDLKIVLSVGVVVITLFILIALLDGLLKKDRIALCVLNLGFYLKQVNNDDKNI